VKIGICCNRFIEWGGGIGFIQICVESLLSIKDEKYLQIVLLIPDQKLNNVDKYKNEVKKILNIFRKEKLIFKKKSSYSELIKQLFVYKDYVSYLEYSNNINSLQKVSLKNNIDVIIPSFDSLGKKFKIPWVGYIYDFQHRYFTQNFTTEEVLQRDILFETILNSCKSVIVNSKKVKSDIIRFQLKFEAKIFDLPFSPFFKPQKNLDFKAVIDNYKLPNKYFIISNQFWEHKDHITAFKAYANFFRSTGSEIKLLCSGKLEDYRNPEHIVCLKKTIKELNIENRIVFLGFIDKADLSSIIENAVAMIQPTLFEGGPGGGAVYDAVGLGVPVILSDIEINKEIEDLPNLIFFKAGDFLDLADKMQKSLSIKKINVNLYAKKFEIMQKELGLTLFKAIQNAIEA